MNSLKFFGKRIKELRKHKNLTQEQLADIIDLDPKQVCRIENGACFTTFETLEKIANIFGVEISQLFDFSHKQPRERLIQEMNEIFTSAADTKIELIYKIVKNLQY